MTASPAPAAPSGRPARPWARRSTAVLALAAATCLVGASTASADNTPGSGFGFYKLSANAPVLQARYEDATPGGQCGSTPAGSAACEGVVNETVASLQNGPVGHALSSFAWPGTLAANLGTLLIVAGNAPSQATMLNDPVKAENTTGGGVPTVTNSTVPGATMTATATPADVTATSTIGASQAGSAVSFGTVHSTSTSRLTGASTAEAVAHSEITDLDVAGVLRIGTVVSDAKATTDGSRTVTSGATKVVGATVAGIPVSIGPKGIALASTGVPLASTALDTVDAALKQLGMTVSVGSPSTSGNGTKQAYSAAALTIVWHLPAAPVTVPTIPGLPVSVPSQPGVVTLVLGGAQVAVDSAAGYSFGGWQDGTTPAAPPAAAAPAAAPPAVTTNGGTLPVSTGTAAVPGPLLAQASPVLTSAPDLSGLPHGVSPWLGAFAVVAAGLVMLGLRRLPDQLLTVPATSCSDA